MKKTLAALVVSAFAASAANAAMVYNNEGTSVNVDGSVRVILSKDLKGDKKSSLQDDGSRVKFTAKTQLGDGIYALGALRLKVKDDNSLTVNRAYAGLGGDFGQITFGQQATAGDDITIAEDKSFGVLNNGDYIRDSGRKVINYTNKIGDVSFGASYLLGEKAPFLSTIMDDAKVVDSGYTLTLSKAVQAKVAYEGNGIIARLGYGHEDIVAASDKDIPVATNSSTFITNFNALLKAYSDLAKAATPTDVQKQAVGTELQKFGIGASNGKAYTEKEITDVATAQKYLAQVENLQEVKDFFTARKLSHKSAFVGAIGYDFGPAIISIDGGYARDNGIAVKEKKFYVSPGFQVKVSDQANVYGNFSYEVSKANLQNAIPTAKTSNTSTVTEKTKSFLLGTDYNFNKHVQVFAEGKYIMGKLTNHYVVKDSNTPDNDRDYSYSIVSKKEAAIGVGLRVFF